MVKCSDCGFFALRQLSDNQLVEVTEVDRHGLAKDTKDHYESQPGFSEYPLCFASAYDLRAEIDAQDTSTWLAAINVALAKRDCDSFTEWQQGFTPKEHREMLDRQRLLEWQTAREDADKKWRSDQAAEERRWRWAQILVFGVAGGIIAIVAALIQKA